MIITKRFGKILNLFLQIKKGALQRNITIIENNTVYTENEEVAEKFNIYFTKAVENLEIEPFTVVEEVNMISGSIYRLNLSQL